MLQQMSADMERRNCRIVSVAYVWYVKNTDKKWGDYLREIQEIFPSTQKFSVFLNFLQKWWILAKNVANKLKSA
jgi:hypothetical protein